MSSPRLHLAHSGQPSQPPNKTHLSNPLVVVADAGWRRRRSQAEVLKADVPLLWQRFVQHVFGAGVGARERTAKEFSVTLQTACNWHDGVVGPMGHAVAHASQAFPDEYDAVFRPDRQRRAA